MKSSLKHKKFKLTFAVIVRLAIFFILIALIISYLGSSKTNLQPKDPTVLGTENSNSYQLNLLKFTNTLYLQLPENSRRFIENFSTNSNVRFLQDKLNSIKIEAHGFPQKQINDIKKEIINSIYHDLMKNINSST